MFARDSMMRERRGWVGRDSMTDAGEERMGCEGFHDANGLRGDDGLRGRFARYILHDAERKGWRERLQGIDARVRGWFARDSMMRKRRGWFAKDSMMREMRGWNACKVLVRERMQ